jgi:hypothetical protein
MGSRYSTSIFVTDSRVLATTIVEQKSQENTGLGLDEAKRFCHNLVNYSSPEK